MNTPPVEYAHSHFPEFLEKLASLVKIPSVSFPGYPPRELIRSAEAVAALLKDEGLENVECISSGDCPPYVYGDWLKAPGKPTLLLYAHHDVQPVGREELWKTSPFEPKERDGRLFGRGAADDKAGIIVHSSAIGSYLKTVGSLPVNVKVLIEGEEEVGSGHLAQFLKSHRKKLQADVVVLTDTDNFDTGIPTITTSLRGVVVTEVIVNALRQSLHSGMWGGPTPDPAMALSKMLASLVDENGRIAIAGIYDKIRPLSSVEEKSIRDLGYDNALFRKQAGLLSDVEIVGGSEPPLVKRFRLPSLAINAIEVSSRKSAGNIIAASAWCRVGIRTVPDMNARETLTQLQEHLRSHAPWGVQVSFEGEQMGDWWVTDPSGPPFQKAAEALALAFGKPTVFLGQGGSIPFVGPFTEQLGGIPALLIGVEDPYTNAHSENESVHLGDLKKSIIGTIHLYRIFGERILCETS